MDKPRLSVSGTNQRRRRGDSNPRYLAVRRFSRPVHSATLPPLRRSRGLCGADCREFSDYVNHSFLVVITPVWFVIRILESELFRRIHDDDHVWESSILTRGITNRLSPSRFRWNGWSFPRDDAGGFDLSSEDFVFARQVERVEFRVAEADVGHPCGFWRKGQNEVAAAERVEYLQAELCCQISTTC